MPDIDVLDRLLADRWSCRGFTEEPVDPATIERLLLAAQRSPSWCNTQPWHVVVISGDETERLRDAMPRTTGLDPTFRSRRPTRASMPNAGVRAGGSYMKLLASRRETERPPQSRR